VLTQPPSSPLHAADPRITIRELRAGDETAIDHLITGLDPESRFLRWFSAGVDIHAAVDWAAHPARCGAVGLLALAGEEPVGHAVLIVLHDGRGEVAFEVAAPWRHHGIAGGLLERLLAIAAARGLREIYADVLPGNRNMLAVLREHGEHAESRRDGIITVTIPVLGAVAAARDTARRPPAPRDPPASHPGAAPQARP
jgi:GNAT superfamily N-acetyltransferase